MLDDIFGENEIPNWNIYRAAQRVVKTYMEKTNKKIDYVARELGTTQGYLRKQLDPNQPDRPLSIDRVISITKLTGDYRILEEIAKEFDFVLVPRKQEASNGNINDLADEANIENNDVFRVIKIALKDGIISKEERKAILKEIDEAQKANAKLKFLIENLKVEE